MKYFVKTVALLVFAMCIGTGAQAQKFGYVNSAAILSQLPDVKQAEATLEALQKQLQKKGQGMVEVLEKEYTEVQQKVERGELSPKQQEEAAAALKTKEQEIGAFEQDMAKQLQDKRTSLLQPIYDKVNTAIADVAKENGFQLIFDQGVLLYAEATQDVSAMVKTKLGITN